MEEAQKVLGKVNKDEKYLKLSKFFGESQTELQDTRTVLTLKQELKEYQLSVSNYGNYVFVN